MIYKFQKINKYKLALYKLIYIEKIIQEMIGNNNNNNKTQLNNINDLRDYSII